ncbi:hypothetical protein D3C71_1274860 [compost metagenome]
MGTALTGGFQCRCHKVKIQIVNRQCVLELIAVFLQQAEGHGGHAVGGVRQRGIDKLNHLAAAAFADLLFHHVGLVQRDLVQRIGEDQHAGFAAGLHHGILGGNARHFVRVRGDVIEHVVLGDWPRLRHRVPGRQHYALLNGLFQRDLGDVRVPAADHYAVRFLGNRLIERGQLIFHRATAVEGFQLPARGFRRFAQPFLHPLHTAVFHVRSDKDDFLVGLQLWPAGGAVPLSHAGSRLGDRCGGLIQIGVGPGG